MDQRQRFGPGPNRRRQQQLPARRRPQAVRGHLQAALVGHLEVPDLLDLLAPELHPQRVLLGGWEDVEDAAADGLWAPPCRELLLTPAVRSRAKALALVHPELVDILDRIADGTPVEGMEALAPVLADDLELLLDVLPAGAHVVVCDPENVRARAHDLVRTSREFLEASWSSAAAGGKAPIDLGAGKAPM